MRRNCVWNDSTNYKGALKYGFYELQSARYWYHEVTSDTGMHVDLVTYWIRIFPLLVTPIAPHFAEHLYRTMLGMPTPGAHDGRRLTKKWTAR